MIVKTPGRRDIFVTALQLLSLLWVRLGAEWNFPYRRGRRDSFRPRQGHASFGLRHDRD
jgi:hypothetical protein